MLVDVTGDGDVSAHGVSLDGESADRLPTSALFMLLTPDVKAFARRAYLDVVLGIVGNELRGHCGQLISGKTVVEVNAANSVTEDKSDADAGR